MTEFTDFKLPSGATVYVQSTLDPPAKPGIEQASAFDKARETWNDGLALVGEMASGVVAQLRAATEAAEEVSVEFGVNLRGKTGIILVEGEAAANLKVTITWKGEKEGA
jgi:hypothetical protein